VGEFSWFELYTPSPDAAWKFYETLFGWEKTSAMDMGEMGLYQMFGRGGGVPSGGMMKPPPGAPAAWMPYAMVKDAKAAAAAATASGATIVNGPMEVPGGDWIAQGIDPQGAMFSVHSLKPAAPKPAPAKKAAPARRAAPAKKKAATAKKAPRAKKNSAPIKKSAKKRTANKAKPARKAPKKKAAKRKK
jgi:predicted enzyme related to lactoylglutathione lyase